MATAILWDKCGQLNMSDVTELGINKMWEIIYRVMYKGSWDRKIYLERLVHTCVYK